MVTAETILRAAGRIAATALLVLAGYGAAGMIGGAIPANAGWRPPAEGVTVYVEDNGIHVGLVVPKRAAGLDLGDLSPPRDLRDPSYAARDHLAIGWGERGFYLGTPTWADLRLATLVSAAAGSDDTVMHVEHVPRPPVSADVRTIRLRPSEYRRLVVAIRAGFVAGGRRYPGYAGYDAFYQARGHYSALETCNAWAGDMLRAAGVRTGRWTPFPVTVMAWF